MDEKIERKCESCKFSVSEMQPPPSIERMTVCKRFPPTAVLIYGKNGGQGLTAVFPPVAPASWCHEWTVRPGPRIVADA